MTTITPEQLFAKIGLLQMENEYLRAELQRLQQEIAELRKEAKEDGKRKDN